MRQHKGIMIMRGGRAALRNARIAAAMLLAMAPAMAPIAAWAGAATGREATVSAADQALADALLARMLAAISANPGASMAQVEGQVMLAISQAQVNCTVSQIALSRLQQAVARQRPAVRAAVARAETMARGCLGGSIAGIGPGNGALGLLQQGTVLGLASGGSNYLTAP